jgi:hypothetical protein
MNKFISPSLLLALVALASLVARAKWGTLGFHE